MTIANIIDGRPSLMDRVKATTTLIVATPALVPQWMSEIRKHANDNLLVNVLHYMASHQLRYSDPVQSLQQFDIVITTYARILKRYPWMNPPKELVTEEQKLTWWREYFENNRGPFFRIMWRRIVLDEAQCIKNHRSRTSIACQALPGEFRWAITGTPIQNSVEEFYPYFAFLQMKHAGSSETFKENFCGKTDVARDRLHGFLRMIMLRRTHADTMFNEPLLKLPQCIKRITGLNFNDIEHAIYLIFGNRFIVRINEFSAAGSLDSQYRQIFTMLLRLRMLTGHIFLVQECIEDLLDDEDLEELRKLIDDEPTDDPSSKTILFAVRKLLTADSHEADDAHTTQHHNMMGEPDIGGDADAGDRTAKFTEYL